jgi:predicted nucleotidyltransferase
MSLNRVAFKESILKSPVLDFAQKKVEENDEIIMVVLMGSEVSGLALPDSDIDIAIFTHRS